MEEFSFYLYDITYKVQNNKPIIYLFGRTSDGKQICIKDSSFLPYTYVIPKNKKSVIQDLLNWEKKEGEDLFKVVKIESFKKKLFEKPVEVLKVTTNLPNAIPIIRKELKTWDDVENVLEHDILFIRRYLIDKQITPCTLLRVEAEPTFEQSKVPVFNVVKIFQESYDTPKPKVLSIDIETYNPSGKRFLPKEHPIIMIALYGEDFKKVLTWKRFETKEEYIEFLSNEADVLQRFQEIIDEYKPDIITGYFSDMFDFPYIKTRANKYKIWLELSLDKTDLYIKGTTNKVAVINGRVHIDIYPFIKRVIGRSLETDSYSLNSVAKELLGEHKYSIDIEKLAGAWDSNNGELLNEFCKYNLQDAKLNHDLFLKLSLNMFELVKVIGLPLADITRMSFSQYVEWYTIKHAFAVSELVPNKPSYAEQTKRMSMRIKGAFVYEPTPGLYENIVVFDYKSLYPSIIASHNISPGTLRCSCCKEKSKVPFEEAEYWFCKKKKGFLSSIIGDIIKRRASIKEMLKENKDVLLLARSEALKVLANAFYGYLGFAPARWYCFECAESTTAYGRYYIKKVIEQAKQSGFFVCYSDTDSCFILLKEKTKEEAQAFREKVNESLPEFMELDYQGFYPSGLFVGAKATGYGAKKKYALIDEKNHLQIKGFETVRRNWSFIAKEVQSDVLKILLQEKNKQKAIDYVQKIIQDLRSNKLPLDKVVIHTQLQKEVESYDSVGPHVAAAKRIKERNEEVTPGMIIKFVVVKGFGKIRDKVKLEDEAKQEEYDGEYYVTHQVIPSLERIFSVLNINIKKAINEQQQSTLGGFF
ncbi:ribonuclease H-like domain-containing protein [Candidatus Woesearchaeota archaeon]|nr:ribonuclease H-like domain-containing protein [Candidatus Woesearchaeota archaeon]